MRFSSEIYAGKSRLKRQAGVNPEKGADHAVFFPCGKAGGLRVRRCPARAGFEVDLSGLQPWRHDSEALRFLQRRGKTQLVANKMKKRRTD